MTGLILAGVDPVDAVLVQAVVMFLVLGAAATTTTVIGLGMINRLFTPDHRLVRLTRSPRYEQHTALQSGKASACAGWPLDGQNG